MEKINSEIERYQIYIEKELAYRAGFKEGFQSLALYLDTFIENRITGEMLKGIWANVFEYIYTDLDLWASENGIEMQYPKPDCSQYSLFMARKRRLKEIGRGKH